jgi:glucosylceramidase
MSNPSSRRHFLKLSGLGLAASTISAVAAERLLAADRRSSSPDADVHVWVTDEKRRHAQAPSVAWRPVSGPAAENAVVVEPAKKCQEILGFGGAFTDAACDVIGRLPAVARGKLLHELFNPSEMGLSVCRTCIGASDYSTNLFSYDEGEPDPEMKRFSIDHDRQFVLPVLRAARKENPDLFLFSSPWSPPGWMKGNGSMLGGCMKRGNLSVYAKYFLKFLQAYEQEQVPIDAVTIQNEVDTEQDGQMPACVWPQEYEVEFVARHLGPLFVKNGVKTKIWLLDHNYNLWGRAIGELETPGVRRYADAIAWHGYGGNPAWMSRVHDAYPQTPMYWTEGGPDYKDPFYATDWDKWGATLATILRNWCRSITTWNLALDEQGRPNIGPFSCGGLITIHSKTGDVSYSGQYWALAHYSRHIRRGGHRLESQGQMPGLYHAAFENPGGTRVLVLTNQGPARTVQVRIDQRAAEVALPTQSVTTLTW